MDLRMLKKKVLLRSQLLLQKVAQLEEARAQKEKFIHSSRMIVKFREDHISRLEKKLKGDQVPLLDKDSEVLVDQLKAEITLLKDQVRLKRSGVMAFLDLIQSHR